MPPNKVYYLVVVFTFHSVRIIYKEYSGFRLFKNIGLLYYCEVWRIYISIFLSRIYKLILLSSNYYLKLSVVFRCNYFTYLRDSVSKISKINIY